MSGNSSSINDNVKGSEDNHDNSEEDSDESDNTEPITPKGKTTSGERLVEKILGNLWPDPAKK